MLVLTRKVNESIIIDDHIEIKIIHIEEGKIKLGISAPKDVSIHRKEIYLEIQQENQNAALGSLNLEHLSQLLKK
jgi:carbon storage regulator